MAEDFQPQGAAVRPLKRDLQLHASCGEPFESTDEAQANSARPDVNGRQENRKPKVPLPTHHFISIKCVRIGMVVRCCPMDRKLGRILVSFAIVAFIAIIVLVSIWGASPSVKQVLQYLIPFASIIGSVGAFILVVTMREAAGPIPRSSPRALHKVMTAIVVQTLGTACRCVGGMKARTIAAE